jgi:integrase
MIRKFSLNFYCLGKPDTNQNYSLYLRYLYTLNGKKECKNIPTDYTLSKEQLFLLKKGELKGKLQTDLLKLKHNYIQLINVLRLKNNSYPSIEELKEYFNKTENELGIEYYIKRYMQSLAVKQSTKNTYSRILSVFKEFYLANLQISHWSVKDIINVDFIKAYRMKLEFRNRTNNTIRNHLITVLRFLNHTAKEMALDIELKYDDGLDLHTEQLHITDEIFNALLDFDTSKIKHKATHRNLNHVKAILRLNSVIGLRISELLSIKFSKVEFNPDYVVINFIETKKNKSRSIVIVDKTAIDIIDEYMLNCKGELLFDCFKDYSAFNYSLKKLAKFAFEEAKIEVFRMQKNNPIYAEKLLNKVISSHAIRRYAIQKNLVKYGVELAKSYSGHSSYEMIQKHYSRPLNEKEQLQLLTKSSNK